ncbi:MAG: YwaF family protein [Clostridia bacterium]|nr:YwaF family protein [Clostridia bacterium]
MAEFFELTAWPMEKPAPYGAFHLTFALVGLAVVVALAYALRRSDERRNRAVLLTVGVFLCVCELYKQLFYFYVIGAGSYQWWIFPFQLCSVPMYFCIIGGVLKDCRVRRAIYNFMLAFNLMGGFMALTEPSGLVHEYWTLTIHAFIWHITLVFVGLYLGFSKRAGLKLSDYKSTVLVFCALCLVAFGINLALREVSGASVNMFFIGPSISPIIVFKDIATRYGWYVNAPIYMLCACLGAFIFYAPFALYNSRSKKVKPAAVAA